MCTKTFCSLDTGYYADTVEWCPAEGFEDFLVCGTYQLLEKSDRDTEFATCSEGCSSASSSDNVRVGNLQLYRLDETLERPPGLQVCEAGQSVLTHLKINLSLKFMVYRLEKLQTFETAGVLDIKWLSHPINGCPVFGAVTSDGEIKIFFMKEEQLVEETSHVTSQGKLCLSMDWSAVNGRWLGTVSDSGGQLTLFEFSEGTHKPRSILQWIGHQYEAWITAFDAWNSSVVYSGGDDCLLRGWDTRTDCQHPIFTSKKHEMGVSSIQCNLLYQNIMATGSYDENILVWDTRNMRLPLCSSHPGGGVWRIKWHSGNGQTMLTACMYEGFHILKFNNTNADRCLEKLVSYTDQVSLAYGADWCRRKLASDVELEKDAPNERFAGSHNLIATCSFYDHALNMWKV